MGLMIREGDARDGRDIYLGYGIQEGDGGWLLYAIAKFGQATRPCIARRGLTTSALQRLWRWGKKFLLLAAFIFSCYCPA